MSAGPDIRQVGAALEQLVEASTMRTLMLDIQVGDDGEDFPAHLVVPVHVSPAAVELLKGLAATGAGERLGPHVEAALVAAIDAELADLRARTDTLTAALQAAGPSPLRVPPTDPSPAPASSPRPLAALPGGRADDDVDEPPPAAGADPDDHADDEHQADIAAGAAAPTRDPDDADDRAGAGGQPEPPAARPRPARAAARRPAGTGGLRGPLRAAARPSAGGGVFALPPLRERILATLADLPSGETLKSGELQSRCRASQPSVDKALRELITDGTVLRLGEKGRYRYQAATKRAGARAATSTPAPAGAAAGSDRGASAAPPPATPLRRPLPNGKTGRLSARPSGTEGSTLGGRILATLQMSDQWPEGIRQRIGEPLADVEQALEELRAEEDVSRLPDGRFRAVL